VRFNIALISVGYHFIQNMVIVLAITFVDS
jgi:hypothetical protein